MNCGVIKKNGEACKAPGMENGRCRVHGGKSGRPITTGRYSLKHRASLQAKAAEFLSSSAPGDLTGELGLMRALMQDFLDRYPEGVPMPIRDIEIMFGMIDSIGRTVERIAKILNQTGLTQAEVQLLQTTLVNLVVKYIDEPDKRLGFISELRTSLGGIGADRGATAGALAGGAAG